MKLKEKKIRKELPIEKESRRKKTKK